MVAIRPHHVINALEYIYGYEPDTMTLVTLYIHFLLLSQARSRPVVSTIPTKSPQ